MTAPSPDGNPADLLTLKDRALGAGDRITSAVTDWCQGSPDDDVSLLAIERTTPGA